MQSVHCMSNPVGLQIGKFCHEGVVWWRDRLCIWNVSFPSSNASPVIFILLDAFWSFSYSYQTTAHIKNFCAKMVSFQCVIPFLLRIDIQHIMCCRCHSKTRFFPVLSFWLNFWKSDCGDVVKKPKLDQHRFRCHGGFDCIDCSTAFYSPEEYRLHTSCISEAEKYQKSLYKGLKSVCLYSAILP